VQHRLKRRADGCALLRSDDRRLNLINQVCMIEWLGDPGDGTKPLWQVRCIISGYEEEWYSARLELYRQRINHLAIQVHV
jgi:hypothetical protein